MVFPDLAGQASLPTGPHRAPPMTRVAMAQSGRFVETKEKLGGVAVDVRDDAEARYWPGRIAVGVGWPQEVHRF
jgi:hypothetical protein